MGDVVQIDWLDSKSFLGWRYATGKPRVPGMIRSVGYAVQENESCITITNSLDKQVGATLDELSIPVGCIEDIKVLKKTEFEAV